MTSKPFTLPDRGDGQVKTLRRFRAPTSSPSYRCRMGHLLFAVALFVGLVLIVEWLFLRHDEKKRADKRF